MVEIVLTDHSAPQGTLVTYALPAGTAVHAQLLLMAVTPEQRTQDNAQRRYYFSSFIYEQKMYKSLTLMNALS